MTSFISSYINTIVSVAICAFICETITSSGREALHKGQRLITSLCIFISLVLPVCNALIKVKPDLSFGNTFAVENGTLYSSKTYLSLIANETETVLQELITKTFGIQPDNISINISEESNDMQKHLIIDSITVSIKADEETTNNIKQFISNELDIGSESIYVIGEEGND